MKDGFILFYVKDNEVLPVAMNQEKLDMLQTVVPIIFGEETPQVFNKSMGEVEDLFKNTKTSVIKEVPDE